MSEEAAMQNETILNCETAALHKCYYGPLYVQMQPVMDRKYF